MEKEDRNTVKGQKGQTSPFEKNDKANALTSWQWQKNCYSDPELQKTFKNIQHWIHKHGQP